MSFSPGGDLLASAGGGWGDLTVRLWDAATQTEVATLKGHKAPVRSVAFSPVAGLLASADGDEWEPTVRLWDVETGKPINTLEEHTGPVHSVTFSLDGAHPCLRGCGRHGAPAGRGDGERRRSFRA